MPRPAALALALALAAPAGAAASDLAPRPFTDTSVCPTCAPDPSDQLTLQSGAVLRADVIAQNPDFYTVTRHGEVRTIPRASVTDVRWKGGTPPPGVDARDQIVLTHGHVLTGTITNEDKTLLQLRDPTRGQAFIVNRAQARAVYKAGRPAS